MPTSALIQARVPEQLHEALTERAETAGVSTSDVVRAALVRELERPVDKRTRSAVASWLEGFEHVGIENDVPATSGASK